jgi:hypothetical protein
VGRFRGNAPITRSRATRTARNPTRVSVPNTLKVKPFDRCWQAFGPIQQWYSKAENSAGFERRDEKRRYCFVKIKNLD